MSHRLRVSLRSAALVAALGALLAACSSSSSGGGSESSGSSGGKPVSGGSLTYSISTDGGCIDPQQVGNNDQIAIARQTVASLTIQDAKTGKILPWVAQSWDINADSSQFTFHLRADAKYADGTPIDAASVKANYEGIVALGASASLGSSYLGGLTGITVVDPHTVQISFGAPNIQFLQASSTFSLGLISTASTQLSVADRCAGKFIGSGPFAVQSFTTMQETILKRVPGYDLGTAANDHIGAAYLDTIDYKVIPEVGVVTGSLQSGQIDATTAIPANQISLFSSSQYSVQSRPNPGVVFNLFPNLSRPIVSDPQVLQAISLAIDRPTIATTINGAGAASATAVISKTTPLYTDLSSSLTYNAKKAESILDADGWAVGSDGIRAKNGTKLSLYLPFYQTQDPVVLVQQELKAVGIDLQIKQVPLAQLTAIKASGDYDFQYYNLTRADPDVLRTIFSIKASNVNNRTTSSQIDDLLSQEAGESDTTKRQALIAEVQKDLITQGWAIPIYPAAGYLVASSKVHDLKYEASSRMDFYDAWVTP